MARNTLRDMLVDYYFPRQGIIEYAMTPGQAAGQNRLATLGGGPGGGENTGGAVTMPPFRYGGFDQTPEAPPAEGGGGGGMTLPEIIQQYFPDSDFKSGGAGMGGGGGGQGMGRSTPSTAPNVASQGFPNDVMAAFDALSGAPMTPVGLMDTILGMAFAENFDEMPSAWNALMDALGLGGDRGSMVDPSVEAGAIQDISRAAGPVGAYNNPAGPLGVTPGLPNLNPNMEAMQAGNYGRGFGIDRDAMKESGLGPNINRGYGGRGSGGGGRSGGGGGSGHGNHGAHGGAGARGNRR